MQSEPFGAMGLHFCAALAVGTSAMLAANATSGISFLPARTARTLNEVHPLANPPIVWEHVFVSEEKATILHADADAFFASVEQRDDPSLRGRPVAVGGGIITAASYEARAHGVSAPMGGAKAKRLCPGLVIVKPHWEAYVEASRDLFRVFRDTAPDVEGISLEEAFMDVRGLDHISG